MRNQITRGTAVAGEFQSRGGVGKFGADPPTSQPATIADAGTANDVTGADTVSQAAVEAALDDLGTKVNAVIAALKADGTIAS